MTTSPLGRSTVFAALAAIAVVATGCSDVGIGRKCLAPNKVMATQISSPALECMSRLCFLKADATGNPQRSVCTAHCTTDDDLENPQTPALSAQNTVTH